MKLFVLFSFLFPLIFFCTCFFFVYTKCQISSMQLGPNNSDFLFQVLLKLMGKKRRKASSTRVCRNSKNFLMHVATPEPHFGATSGHKDCKTVTILVGHVLNRRWSSACWLKGRRYPSTNLQVCSGRSSACTNAVMSYYTLAYIAGWGSNLVSRRAAPRPAMTICRLLRTNGLFCPWLLLTVFLSAVHFALLSSAGSQRQHQIPQSACKVIFKKQTNKQNKSSPKHETERCVPVCCYIRKDLRPFSRDVHLDCICPAECLQWP